MRGKKARMLRQVADLKGYVSEELIQKDTNHLTNEKGQIILGACVRRLYKLLKKGQQNDT